MKKVLIIGAGGVGRVASFKIAGMLGDCVSELMLASRTLSKCDNIAKDIRKKIGKEVQTRSVDADNVQELIALFREFKPFVVVNLALPYQDLTIMDACLETGVHYLDTANYEPRENPKFEYHWQWDYHDRFKNAGIMALLGSGFDPGMTNVYCAHAAATHFDTIDTIDIIDCNAGDHGLPFATNFNPEINIREITQAARWWNVDQWEEVEPMSINQSFDFPEGIGPKDIYLLYHEEIESLSKHLDVNKIRFWMTFSEKYLTHLRVLENVGMTSIEPVEIQGTKIAPLEFLKAVLPDPASLGPLTRGKTCIGCLLRGKQQGKEKTFYIYNICDHESSFDETGAQAVSYTTGVPAATGTKMMLTEKWFKSGVWNMEQFDPDPFLAEVSKLGLPYIETILPNFTPDSTNLVSVGAK